MGMIPPRINYHHLFAGSLTRVVHGGVPPDPPQGDPPRRNQGAKLTSQLDLEDLHGQCCSPDPRPPPHDKEDLPRRSNCPPYAKEELCRLIARIESRIAFLEEDHLPHRGWSTQLDSLHDTYLEGLRMFVNKGTWHLTRVEASNITHNMEPLKLFLEWNSGQESSSASKTRPLTVCSSLEEHVPPIPPAPVVVSLAKTNAAATAHLWWFSIATQDNQLIPIKQLEFGFASPLPQVEPKCIRFTEINDDKDHPDDIASACTLLADTRSKSLKRPRDSASPPPMLVATNKRLKPLSSDGTLELGEDKISASTLRTTPPPTNHQSGTGTSLSSSSATTPTSGSPDHPPTTNHNSSSAAPATPMSGRLCPASTPLSSNHSALSVAAATTETPETDNPPSTPLTDNVNELDVSAETPKPGRLCALSTPFGGLPNPCSSPTNQAGESPSASNGTTPTRDTLSPRTQVGSQPTTPPASQPLKSPAHPRDHAQESLPENNQTTTERDTADPSTQAGETPPPDSLPPNGLAPRTPQPSNDRIPPPPDSTHLTEQAGEGPLVSNRHTTPPDTPDPGTQAGNKSPPLGVPDQTAGGSSVPIPSPRRLRNRVQLNSNQQIAVVIPSQSRPSNSSRMGRRSRANTEPNIYPEDFDTPSPTPSPPLPTNNSAPVPTGSQANEAPPNGTSAGNTGPAGTNEGNTPLATIKQVAPPSPDREAPHKRAKSQEDEPEEDENTFFGRRGRSHTPSRANQSHYVLKKGKVYEGALLRFTERVEPDEYFRAAFLRVIRKIDTHRELVDGHSASQRPPLNPADPYVLDVSSSKWENCVKAMHSRQFLTVVNSYPRLFQLPWPHPFINEKHVRVDVLVLGINECLSQRRPGLPPLRAGGWTALQEMMCRSSPRLPHHQWDFRTAVAEAASRAQQLVMDATKYVRPNDGVPPQGSLADTEQEIETDGLGRVLLWLSSRISTLESSGEQEHKAHKDGIHFLLKKCWEMLLAINLMHDARDTDIRKSKNQTSNLRATITKGGRTVRGAKDLWHAQRKKAYSSLAIFLNFGVAGWLVCHRNHRKYNLQDVMSLFSLAWEMAENNVTINSKLTRNRATRGADAKKPIHRSWERLNDYLMDLILDTGLQSNTINWRRAAAQWDRALTEANIAPLILKDFFTEVLTPGDTLSSSCDASPLPQINEREVVHWQIRAGRVFVPIARHQAIQERLELASGILEQTLGQPEVTDYNTDGSEPDAEGEDDDGDYETYQDGRENEDGEKDGAEGEGSEDGEEEES
ncbi:hypothetical protein PCASD_10193 [Puccinia coronata f. sp. avenae]|uniref:Golgi to ER traffic-protein n=1 Tax=Puccinia coronata f. sp. avenae TaxID=200324 RepID=A0A2N5UGR8_9BASI|nr:hypothetical protein PCASD_10193 [Puccinia coronata f. sp. avenae]